jgi:hypothetical protein
MSEKLVTRICEAVQYDLARSVTGIVDQISRECESPIETLFLSTFMTGLGLADIRSPGEIDFWKIRTTTGREIGPRNGALIITPQFRWRSYRIDFAFYFLNEEPRVFVECDGHDFHERTPEQAERDRRRDREVQAAGIRILRFTGREIWRDPVQCVMETIKAVRDQ